MCLKVFVGFRLFVGDGLCILKGQKTLEDPKKR